MSLKHSYTLIAPFYDAIVSGPLDSCRIKSLSRLEQATNQAGINQKILINGIGSGLDIPHLPDGAQYVGTDITPAMLNRAKKRAQDSSIDIVFQLADSQALPFEDNSFDAIIMHLILAVVPDPAAALQEASRVLRTNGTIYLFDKFIKPGQLAIARRLLSVLIRHIATRTDVVFEEVLATCPQLKIIDDDPILANGWFRLIELKKI
jgi:ubiquinone/menaquinone biosynthesis C-methylase UbiE